MPTADKVPPSKRLFQVISSVFFCFTTAGVVFGYAALKPVLLASGVYSHMCQDGQRACAASDTRMNLMFTLATVVTNGAALPIGSMLDRYGPQRLAIGGAIVFALGNFVFGLQQVHGVLDTYIIGYVLLALGSPAIFFAQFHLSNAFPAYSGVILAALTGAFDASSVPYLVYREIFQRTGGKVGIRTFFWLYTLIPTLIIIQQLVLGPKTIYHRPPPSSKPPPITTVSAEENEDPSLNIVATESYGDHTVPVQQQPHLLAEERDIVCSGFSRVSYPVWQGDDTEEEVKVLDHGKGDALVGVMFDKSVKEQLRSGWFWLIAVYLFVQMLRINWYLATVQSQLEFYTGNVQLADKLTKAFTVLLPMGGIIGIPFVGLLLDNRPILDATLVLLVCGTSFGILTMLSSTAPQLIGIAVLVLLRPLFYTFVSDFVAKIFGFVTFGTVYGLAVTISGLLGLLLTPMDMLTKGPLHGDYNPINLVLLVVGGLTNLALAVRIWVHVRKGRIALG